MEFENTFVVNAPIEEVWETLMDVERVAGCIPGARVLNQLSDKAYQVAMHVRLGPMSMQYRGQMEIVERNDDAHRAVMLGRAKEAHGQGTADATAELVLTEDGDRTRGSVNSDLRLSGRVAAMGRGVIADVADQIVKQFVGNLEELMAGPAAHDRSDAAVAEGVDVAAAATTSAAVRRPREAAAPGARTTERVVAGAERQVPRGEPSPRGTAGPDSAEGGAALDGLALARAVVRGRLDDPDVVFALLVGVAVVSYLAGRRRSLRPAELERIAQYLAKRR